MGKVVTTVVNRFKDTGEFIGSFLDELWVECPQCSSCAIVLPHPQESTKAPSNYHPRKVTCSGCGFLKIWTGRGMGINRYDDPMRDPYFKLPLWLQRPCCGHILWAFNPRHLSLIEEYVQADLREGYRDENGSYRNSSLANRLPEWMITAKHRESVLKALGKLKNKLCTPIRT